MNGSANMLQSMVWALALIAIDIASIETQSLSLIRIVSS
jgi:hypothetical protein